MERGVNSSALQSDTFQPDKRTIGELLSNASPPIVVPDWQRSYSWTVSHVEAFWKDLLDFDRRNPGDHVVNKDYFLGSIVVVRTDNNEHLLLDGQQRIATSTILLSVVRDHLSKYNVDAAKALQMQFISIIDYTDNVEKFKLTLNAYDRVYFRDKILRLQRREMEPTPSLASHGAIKAAWKYLQSEVDAHYISMEPEAAYKWCLRIQKILTNHVSVISVTSTNEDSAAEVFETLNDRGVSLSTPDLLRNLIIRRSPPQLRGEIVALWREVVDFESDSEIRNFLRHYWISHYGDIKTQRLYREIKNHVIEENIESIVFSNDLHQSAALYKQIVRGGDFGDEIEDMLNEIRELNANILLPYSMSVLQAAADKDRLSLLSFAISAFVRHAVIGQRENSKFENEIHKLALEIRNGRSAGVVGARLKSFVQDDKLFAQEMAGVAIQKTIWQRYLLRKIENAERTTQELSINSNARVHVEHIYPQNPASAERVADHDEVVDLLGNLTLLDSRLNSTIRNSGFSAKRSAYSASEIKITKALLAYKSWSRKTIESRQRELAQKALKIWTFQDA